MRRRRGITLIEVLVAIFIMAIGLLAILTLFPLGALRMSQALQDDRTGAAASQAANLCDAFGVRTDSSFYPANAPNWFVQPPANTGLPTAAARNGSGYPLYVDPWGLANTANPTLGNYNPAIGAGAIPRVTPSVYPAPYNGSTATLAARYFGLLDDLTFQTSGVPDNPVQRGGRYTWAYLLHRSQPASVTSSVDLAVVVYAARRTPNAANDGETSYAATGAINDTALAINWTAGQSQPNIRRGSWVLDTTLDMDPQQQVLLGVHGTFYRVVAVSSIVGNTMNVEVQIPFYRQVKQITVLDNVADVFERGVSDSTKWEFRNEE